MFARLLNWVGLGVNNCEIDPLHVRSSDEKDLLSHLIKLFPTVTRFESNSPYSVTMNNVHYQITLLRPVFVNPVIQVNVDQIASLEQSELNVLSQFFIQTKNWSLQQAVMMAACNDILEASNEHIFFMPGDDDLAICDRIVFDTTLAVYQRHKNANDRRFAVLNHRLGGGSFGTVYQSDYSISVTESKDEIILKIKSKLGKKNRVAKLQKDYLAPQKNETLTDSECRLTRLAAPELKMKANVKQTSNKMSALIMRFLPGEDLYNVLDKDLITNDADRLKVCLAMAENLQEIHLLGIIHRDLKTENVRIAKDSDDEYRVKIFDFGLAIEASHPDYAKCGTMLFAAPEMVRDARTSFKSDVYSLGRIFEIVFGFMPSWVDDGMDAIIRNQDRAFDIQLGKYIDAKRRYLLNDAGLREIFKGMRIIDSDARVPLQYVIAQLRRLITLLAEHEEKWRLRSAPAAASMVPSTLFFYPSGEAAAAAAIMPSKPDFRNKCPSC